MFYMDLQLLKLHNYPLLDLFFYYNIIAYNNESGQNSFTTLFEDIFAEKTNDTVKKYVESLERKGFIYTEPTKVKTKDGRTHNGSLLYTLRPIKPIEEAYFEKKIAIANAQYQARLALEKFEKKHGRS